MGVDLGLCINTDAAAYEIGLRDKIQKYFFILNPMLYIDRLTYSILF